ncbi:homoserine dehydrogenase [Paramicrobacterium agarici]|uniref:Homoserine dehydrogenase n=1 Tax=Paramicrobacterium agarici TaxID=630514 RepID=A0A2A9DYA7_9MICO|nr:homoserine dehydrogenase [Microbacterium agarici]PFG30919.1 homoserine dehydrogenase [Microbacterium agarici]TQO23985.1 homoserine dehydrogenase [Microbacterium agarici]
MIDSRTLRVALLGAGSVGSQVARMLIENRQELAARSGADLELIGIAVRDVDAKRDVELPRELFTTDAESLILGADIVIELMGGIEPAKSHILAAVNAGADVVTGNKALLAAHGPELFAAAEQVGAEISYEASVAAAIPILRPLRDSLAGDNIRSVLAIVNGSTNFILDRMDRFGETMDEASKLAFEAGYLEADPTLDVEGYDAAQKVTILAGLAFHSQIDPSKVHREGITDVTAEQIQAAQSAGYVIKLLAVAERLTTADGEHGISARVYPALVPREHPLASVYAENNAVFVDAEAAGPLMFYGAGAGGVQTASAILGDVVSAARRHVAGGPGLNGSSHAGLPLLPIDDVITKCQINLRVEDRPGVLAEVAGIFSRCGVSVQTVEQTIGEDEEGLATLIIGTHRAREKAIRDVVDALQDASATDRIVSVLRVEGAQ